MGRWRDLVSVRSLTNRPACSDRGVWSPLLLLQGPGPGPRRAEPSRARAGGARRRGCSCGQRPPGGTFSPTLRRALPGGRCGPAGAALPRPCGAGPGAPSRRRGAPGGPGAERPRASPCKRGMALGRGAPLRRGANFQIVPAKCPFPSAVALAPCRRNLPVAWGKTGTPPPGTRAEAGDGTKSVGKPPPCLRSDEGGHDSAARGRRGGDEGSAGRGRPH